MVEDQLRGLRQGTPALGQVHHRLVELSAAVGAWDLAAPGGPSWSSKVSPEAEQRKVLCQFRDVDGVTRCFDLHARFTPGAGRIHFRLVAGSRLARVAYIGAKIGA